MSRDHINQVYWDSRRGMLELDILLMPFAKEGYPELSPEDQVVYRELLAEEDQDLFSWFMQRSKAPDKLHAMVEAILLFNDPAVLSQ